MAWTKVGDLAFTVAGVSGSEIKTLPGSPQEDDVVIVAMSSDYYIGPDVATPGYIYLENVPDDKSPGNMVAYKQLGSTPDTEIEINCTDAENNAGVLQVWRGADGTTPLDAPRTVVTGSGGMPDGPSYDTITNGALVFVVGMLDDDNIASSVTAPSGYSNVLAEDLSVAGDNATTMIASIEKAIAGTEDPGVFGGIGDDAWRVITFALRPAAAAEGWTGKILGVTNPDDINSVAVTDIQKVIGVE